MSVPNTRGVKWLRASEPPEPFPFPAVQKGSPGPNFPPENTNSSSIKLLPAEPLCLDLITLSEERFIWARPPPFITDGARLRCVEWEIHSVEENEKSKYNVNGLLKK